MDLPKILHYVGPDGNIAICDDRNVDNPPRGWAALPSMVTCPDCLQKMNAAGI